jgi:hypothetical protein
MRPCRHDKRNQLVWMQRITTQRLAVIAIATVSAIANINLTNALAGKRIDNANVC